MNIKRFTAPTIGEAMRNIKRELGSEAVILSNHAIEDGFEVVCAIDYDEQLLGALQQQGVTDQTRHPPEPDLTPGPALEPVANLTPNPAPGSAPAAKTRRPYAKTAVAALASLRSLGQGQPVSATANQPDPLRQRQPAALPAWWKNTTPSVPKLPILGRTQIGQPGPEPAIARPSVGIMSTGHASMEHQESAAKEVSPEQQNSRSPWSEDPQLREMRNSLEDLQHLVEERLLGVLWKETSGANPEHARLHSRLVQAGFTDALARDMIGQIPPGHDPAKALGYVLALLSRRLRISRPSLLEQGGVWALVGPAGAGKTSTLIKLATRFLRANGPGSVALVGFDAERIGAHQQLQVYGQLLDIPVRQANSAAELGPALAALAAHPLVLIDSTGFSPADRLLEQQLQTLRGQSAGPIQPLLVVPAIMEADYLRRILGQARALGLRQSVLTRFDESMRPGIGIGSLIEQDMELAFVGAGRKSSADLIAADAPGIFSRVAELIQRLPQSQAQAQSLVQPPAPSPVQSKSPAADGQDTTPTLNRRGIAAHGS